MTRASVHIGLWLLFLSQTLIVRVFVHDPAEWVGRLAQTNVLVLAAFLVIFHLLSPGGDDTRADRADYLLFCLSAVALTVSGSFGKGFDVAMIMGPVGLFCLLRRDGDQTGRFVGLVYLALAVNGFLAPLVFQVLKDQFLIGEVGFAVGVLNLIGFDLRAVDTRIVSEDGMRLQLVGACSVFSNLSLAFLGYSTAKAAFRRPFGPQDIVPMLVLVLGLMMLNALRFGLMSPSYDAYVFWHEGTGVVIFGLTQFLIVCAGCLLPVARMRMA